MNFVKSISIPQTELLKARATVLNSPNAEVALLLMKSDTGKNGIQVPLKRIIQLQDVIITAGGGGFDYSSTTLNTIQNIKARTGLQFAGMGHSHLLRHGNFLSDADKRVIDGQRSGGGNQINMLFKIAEKSGSYTVLVTAFNNLCESIPIDILDEQGNFIKRIGLNTPSNGGIHQIQQPQLREKDLMPPGGFGVPPAKSFWERILGKK